MWITSLSPEDAFWASPLLELGDTPCSMSPRSCVCLFVEMTAALGVAFGLLLGPGLRLQYPLEISAFPPAWIPSSQPSIPLQRFLSPPRCVYSILHYTRTYPDKWLYGQGPGILWSSTEWELWSQDYLGLNTNSTTSNCASSSASLGLSCFICKVGQ